MRRFVPLIVACLASVAILVGNPQQANASTCTATQLVPNLSRLEINQGLGSYARLTRDKPTLVRAYLSLPAAATCSLGTGQALNVTGASLTVSGASGVTIAPTNAAAVAASGALSVPPALTDSPHDPIFVLSGANSATIAGSTNAFTATFTVTVTYTRKLSAKDVPTTITPPPYPGVQKTFEKKSKAIRILFQPLGNGIASTNFTPADRTAVVNAAQTALRVLPVPEGLSTTLTPTTRTGGVRYAINTKILDVSAVAGAIVNGKFCATSAVFNGVAPLLSGALSTFNSAQAADDAADFVVGVYGQEISYGNSDGTACALGMAAVNNKQSIVMAIPDVTINGKTTLSKTGAVLAQELMHNIGAQPSPRSSTFHSVYTQSDASDLDGAYNLSSAAYISLDKTVMRVDSTGWDNTVTVLEDLDFAYALCRWGGTVLTNAECSSATTGGTLTGVPAIEPYVAFGNTAGVVEGYYAGNTLSCPTAPCSPATTTDDRNSTLRLQQFAGTSKLSDLGIPVSSTFTHDATPGTAGVFSFALPGSLTAGADKVQIVDTTNNSVPLFTSILQPAPPTVTSVTTSQNLASPGGTLNFTNTVTPPKNPDGDILFLADTTGSMTDALANVRDSVTNSDTGIVATIRAEQSTAQFGVASYKDFDPPTGCTSAYVYRLEQAITSDISLVVGHSANTDGPATGVNAWEPSGGCDTPEAQLNAFHQIVSTDPTTGFRSGVPHAVAWFGDAPGHNPSGGSTEGTAISDLQSVGIRVVAVSTTSGPGLDAACDTLDCSSGQATRIANATGGAVKPNATSGEVAQALLDGLLSATVEPKNITCDTGLTLTTDQARRVVRSGTEAASFSEQMIVGNASSGDHSCSLDFYVNGQRVLLIDGSPDPAFHQVITVRVGEATAVVHATSFNQNSLADFYYHCPNTPYFPIAVAVPHTGTATPHGSAFDLTFNAQINGALVPGGTCTLTALVSDMFQRSDPASDPQATTTLLVTRKGPQDVAIYTPSNGAVFSTRATILATGGGSDPEGGAMTFNWTLAGPSTQSIPSGPSATLTPPTGGWPIGTYTLTLTGTDTPADGNPGTATTTFSVVADSALPLSFSFDGFFTPIKNWPTANQVNGGQAASFRWRVRDQNGTELNTTAAILGTNGGAQFQEVNCTTRDPIGSPIFNWEVGKTMMRYDTKAGQFVENLTIPAGVGKCYVWTLKLADDTLHPVFLQVVK